MRKMLLSLLLQTVLSTFVLSAEDAPALSPAPTPLSSGKALWKVSLVSLATANALDIHSSWGKRELNPTLSNSSGQFGRQGALIKLGLQGGLFGVEYLMTRGHPSKRLYRVLTVVNFGAAGTLGATAVHNYGVAGPR